MTERIQEFLRNRRSEGQDTEPCLVVDLEVVRDNYQTFAKALPDSRVFYAVKANPAPEVLQLLASMGSCFDTATVAEIEMALAAGATPDRVSYGNTIKKERDIARALMRGAAQKCPACGDGKLYRKYLKVADSCDACGEELHHHRADDAPPYFTILIVGHFLVAGVMMVEDYFRLNYWLHIAMWFPLTIGLCLWFLPRVKGASAAVTRPRWSIAAVRWALSLALAEATPFECAAAARRPLPECPASLEWPRRARVPCAHRKTGGEAIHPLLRHFGNPIAIRRPHFLFRSANHRSAGNRSKLNEYACNNRRGSRPDRH